jgi:hypothetical protein
VVGPNVYSNRKWYANGRELKRVKRIAPDPAPMTIGAVLRRNPDCAHAYLDLGDECAVCGITIEE